MTDQAATTAGIDNTTMVVALIGLFSAIAAATITFFAGRNAAVAVLQKTLMDGFKQLSDMQDAKMDRMAADILRLEGELRQEQQRTSSLKALLRAHGIEIPRETVHAIVYSPYPEDVN